MQAQIKYRDADGNVMLRVLTEPREQTSDKELAKKVSDVRALGTYVAQEVAQMEQCGRFEDAGNAISGMLEMADDEEIYIGAENVFNHFQHFRSEVRDMDNWGSAPFADEDAERFFQAKRTNFLVWICYPNGNWIIHYVLTEV